MHPDGKSTLASVSKWNSGKVNWLLHQHAYNQPNFLGVIFIKGGSLDFEVSQHFSEESGITHQLYIRGEKYTFLESSLNFLLGNVNFESVGFVALILSAVMS